MTQDDTPMWEDPRESSAMRQLLRAGRVENSDYDVERGLARHLAQLQAGAPVPAWAVQTTLQKSAGWSVLAWILPPMISAAVVGAWLAIRPAEPTALAAAAAREAATQNTAAPSQEVAVAAPAAAVQAPAPMPAAEREAPEQLEQRDQRERRDHHVAASSRSARQAPRAASSRRGRSARADEGSNFASANVGRGSGTPSAPSSADSTASVSTTAAAVSGAVAANKVAPAEELAPKQEPAIDEPKAKDKEAKAKPETRSKDQEAAQDEVTGARLEREMRMLAVAQRVLTEDPERSLRLCRQGESEFRGSMFSAERKQVALLALVQLGRVDQARREGIPFLRAYPNAPWSARLREALASGHVPNP